MTSKKVFLRWILLLSAEQAIALTLGNPSSDSVNDSATVCLSVGMQASLTGLDDLVLSSAGVSGAPGTIYEGENLFSLESNGPVSVLVSSAGLSDGIDVIRPVYRLDGGEGRMDTAAEGAHNGEHRLTARYRIAQISAQRAGEYAGQVTLTVTPQLGGIAGCGQFSETWPSQETWGILAWEDLYPSSGDADYNDMVVAVRIEEQYNAQNQLEMVVLDFLPSARGAGYNHAVMLSLDGEIDGSKNVTTTTTPIINGDTQTKATYFNLDSGSTQEKWFASGRDIDVFNNTRSTLSGYANVYPDEEITSPKMMTRIEVQVADPTINLYGDSLAERIGLYRPYLHVMNTNSDIDLASVNPDDGMIDDEGYPFGILIPETWAWPTEQVSIDDAYPYFADYRAWLAGETTVLSPEAENWYAYPTEDADSLMYVDPGLYAIEP